MEKRDVYMIIYILGIIVGLFIMIIWIPKMGTEPLVEQKIAEGVIVFFASIWLLISELKKANK